LESFSNTPFPPVIFLMGPTAAGKTDLAVNLVENHQCDIVSVDSALIYRGMDIGTAKPDAAVLQQAPHRLIDLVDPAESYSVARFRQDALNEIRAIHEQGRIPLLAGGTMLYYKALLEGLADNLPEADESLRQQLSQELADQGLPNLARKLVALDQSVEGRIHLENPQRVLRALEVFLVSGKSITWFWDAQSEAKAQAVSQSEAASEQVPSPHNFPFRTVQIAVAPVDRKLLHKRIEMRFHQMLDQGFQQEVEQLMARGDLHLDLPSMRCVGYRQMWSHLEGSLSYEAMVEKGIIATRQLAKRQLTWLRGWQNVHWFDSLDPNLPDQVSKLLADQALLC